MTIWLVIPLGKESGARADYAIRGEGVRERAGRAERVNERLGFLSPNAAGTHGFTGSTRISRRTADKIKAAIPGLEVYESWPPPGGWDYPSP